jgi:TonB-dependent SusC/RagA subfamily outer membrane receptor
MKAKLILLLVCLFMGVSVVDLSGQKENKKLTITGTVLDVDGTPIVNAVVMIDGKNTSAVTDVEGKYKVKVSPKATRIGIFTFGSGIKEEDIAGRVLINFNFGALSAQKQADNAVAPGNELVNTGYTDVRKKNLTTDVSKVDAEESKRVYSSIYDMLREIPGVSVRGNSINIQDSKNLMGPVPPLIIVDGVPVNDISYLSPSTVKSVEVLKSTAAAMYGSRGYGGVILITTKKYEVDKK